MADLVLDIRIGSPAFGRIIAHDMPTSLDDDYAEWIWVPPGFAHGNFFTESSVIEYFCTGEYNPECEAGISPLSPDIDWSLCNVGLKEELDALLAEGPLITEKDRCGFTLGDWVKDERSRNFLYERLS
jgi:dTDP-4-dehydrorhamnose 3,5-epimerase